MEEHGMYGRRAALYDRIYHFKDYAAETERIAERLAAEGVADGARVLETACGTGNYLVPLAERYRMTGLDVNPGMLDVAREKVGDRVTLLHSDMCDFDLEEPADAVLCLFSSIGYLHPETELPQALAAFHRNLRPGGVILLEPWLRPDRVKRGLPFLQTYHGKDEPLRLARACTGRLEGRKSILDFHWLVAGPDGVEHFTDLHELWCSTEDELLAACDAAGFDARWDDDGVMGKEVDRGAVIGVRRA